MVNSESDLTVLTVVMATPEAKGGAVRAGLTLGDQLGKYVTADTAKMEGLDDEQLFNELDLKRPVIRLPTVSFISEILGLASDHTNAFMWPRLTLSRSLEEYDIVHLHNAMPLWGILRVALACRFHSVPYCVTLHGVSKLPRWPEELGFSSTQRAIFKTTIEKPYDWVLSNAAHLFALTERDQTLVQERLGVESVSVVPNGIPRSANKRTNKDSCLNSLLRDMENNTEAKSDLDNSLPIVLFVGDKRPNKGLGDILDAYESCDLDYNLFIVGSNEDENLERRIADMDELVRDLGYVNRNVLNRLYHQADLFVFPTRSDVFPLVILEALYHETPVISTSIGGIPEIINKQVGKIVPPEEPNQLAKSIEELLRNDYLRRDMGKKGKEHVQSKYSWDKIANDTVDTYHNIISERV